MKNKHTKKALATGHIDTREIKEFDRIALGIRPCVYQSECEKKCAEDKTCQIYKFYRRYPNYESVSELGIGARI